QSGDAQSFFKAAEAQDPNCGRVLAALGEFALQQSDYETARTYFERAQSIAPDEVDSYVFLGDLCERQGSVDEARKWYQEAIRKVSGDPLGYTRLLRLYGRPEFIESYEPQILSLAERAIAVDESARYRVCLDVGDAYMASKRYDMAQHNFERAID